MNDDGSVGPLLRGLRETQKWLQNSEAGSIDEFRALRYVVGVLLSLKIKELADVHEEEIESRAVEPAFTVNPFTTPLDHPEIQRMIEEAATVYERKFL